ncbi:uncharacterized protein LOC108250215 isoform X2 [Kryptolebias marmoratus]|uniref:uncharacterized protein LOC108250215 isoform X2 n=1 Tax=Kryptolebias marmoratus TaxID=37003 RepID=UPI0007F8ECF3|nr:uncharacterized protein LOC108250215 isoform X2 [Kryptolebias marmoratus]
MARATVTKLFFFVILVFIICLPEFFRIATVSKVTFLCLPHQQRNRAKKGGHGRPENPEATSENICDPSPTADDEKWEQICVQKNQTNLTESASETQEVRDDVNTSWFMCETDKNMEELYSTISASGLKVHFEMSVKLQLNDTEILIGPLYGRSNHSSLHLHPPEEEEDQAGDSKGQKEAYYCCLPLLPTSKSANQSCCLLWLANQTVLTGRAKEKLPWKRTDEDRPAELFPPDEWRCPIRLIWLALLCVILLTVVSIVIGQIYLGKKKRKVLPIGYHFTSKQLNVGKKQTDVVISKDATHPPFKLRSWSGLSPIQEVDSQNEIETLLDGNTDHCYAANLHHRGHPPVPMEEQVW